MLIAAWRTRAAKRWFVVGGAGAVVVAAGASVAFALGGNRAPAAPHTNPPAPRAVGIPAQCASWGCTKAQTVELRDGYAVTVWHAGKPGDYRTKPVVELSRHGVSVQWWLWPQGYGWDAAIACSAQVPEPTCVLTDGDGAHSGVAQALVLRAGRLVAPARAAVIADLPTISARDLDRDGYLDVIAVDSDYTPNFAQGHLFWNTFRFTADEFVSTGCAPRESPTEAPPTAALDGTCPKR